MEDNRKFELSEDALDNVAGGRNFGGGTTALSVDYVRRSDYACSNCGGLEFVIVDGSEYHYSGNCMNCGTYNSNVSRVDGYAEIFFR